MISHKEQARRDLDHIYSIDEIDELHVVEGKEIHIIPDDDKLIELKGGGESGVAAASFLFYAKTEDLPKRRAPGSSLNVDGREYTVIVWGEASGMSTVILEQARTI